MPDIILDPCAVLVVRFVDQHLLQLDQFLLEFLLALDEPVPLLLLLRRHRADDPDIACAHLDDHVVGMG